MSTSTARLLLLALVAACTSSRLDAQDFSPDEAVRRMVLPERFEVRRFASEPMVRQPLDMCFDDQGRMWVIQYLQYPNPAGLKRVEVDRYSRTRYDRVPEPPPRGPRGADRITILEDTDGDGQADHAKDFISGLNLASGMALGYGGLFVLQAPYLLFYADRNGDDIPDGDPEVLVKGFGLEDASSVANSLIWGPDGWLYGCQGSTVTSRIGHDTFQQAIWRYHPTERRFELFAEGGGNMWGLDYDRYGNLLASTNVGGFAMLHIVEGGYYRKSFAKHGPLQNPYAFGYFDHVPYLDFHGGHVTSGGIVYQDDAFPANFRGRYIACNVLSHAVYWHDLEPNGTSFTARYGGELLQAHDRWFVPVDLEVGPDGALYVADWRDQRTAHPDPDAEWDRSNGRIYRIRWRGAGERPKIDWKSQTDAQLVDLLGHVSADHRRRARRLLIERGGRDVIDTLRRQAVSGDHPAALECLWTLHGIKALDVTTAMHLLAHADEQRRHWVVRLLADGGQAVPRPVFQRFLQMADDDFSPLVRWQLAVAARRLPFEQGLPLVARLARHAGDIADPHIPLGLWWAIEHHAEHRREVLALFGSPSAWTNPLTRDHLIGRTIRRYAAAGADEDFAACAWLFARAASAGEVGLWIESMNAALVGRVFQHPPQPLADAVSQLARQNETGVSRLRLLSRLGNPRAIETVIARIQDDQTVPADREALVTLAGELKRRSMVTVLLDLISRQTSKPISAAALGALSAFDDPRIADEVVRRYKNLDPDVRPRAIDLLVSRLRSAKRLIAAIETGVVDAATVTPAQRRTLARHHDRELLEKMTRIWGRVHAATPEEKLAEVRRLNNDLRAAVGDPSAGHKLFLEQCGTCHRLYGEGKQLGPDLTTANRHDTAFLLISLVDPSDQIRKEYLSYTVELQDGRVLTGLLVDQSPGSVTLADAKDHRTVIARDEIEQIKASPTSLMPEGLTKKLSPQQLRDLFGYLQSKAAPHAPTSIGGR